MEWLLLLSSKLPGKISPLDLECPPRNTPNTLDWLMVLMEPRTTAKSPKLKIRRFLAKLTPMEMEKSAWTSSSLKSLRSSKRFYGEISTGQRLLHLLFNSLIDSRFDFFLSFFFANTVGPRNNSPAFKGSPSIKVNILRSQMIVFNV